MGENPRIGGGEVMGYNGCWGRGVGGFYGDILLSEEGMHMYVGKEEKK